LKNVPDRVWTVPLLAGVVRSAIQNSTPEQITGLVLTASDLTSVSVEWSAEVNSAEYNVYVDDELFITVLETGASSVILTGLTAGTEYTVNVSGVNAVGVEGALSATLTVETEGGTVVSAFPNWPIMNVSCQQGDITQGVLSTTWRDMVGEKDVLIFPWFYPTDARLDLRTDGLQYYRTNYPDLKMCMYIMLNETFFEYPSALENSPNELTKALLDSPTEGNPNWYVRRLNGDKVGANFSPLTLANCNTATNDAGLNSLGERYDQAHLRMIDEEFNGGTPANFLDTYVDGFFIDNCQIRPPAFYQEGSSTTTVSDFDFDDDGVAELRNLYTSATNAGGRMWEEGALNILNTIKTRFGSGHGVIPNSSRWALNYFESGGQPPPLPDRLSYGAWPDLLLSESVSNQVAIMKTSGGAYTFTGTAGMSLHFRRTTMMERFLGPDSGSAFGKAAVIMHAITPDRTTFQQSDYEYARMILCMALLMPRCAFGVSNATTKPMPLDETFLALGDPIGERGMGTLNEVTLAWTMRSPDFENGVADFHWQEFEDGIVVLRTDSPTVGTWPSADAAVSCTLPFPGSGKKWQMIDAGTYVNAVTGYAMRDQSPSLNNGADVTAVSLKPFHGVLIRRVDA
jgi:hypothetical protein